MSFVKTELLTNFEFPKSESQLFPALRHDDGNEPVLRKRRSSVSSPRKKFFIDCDPTSESDSELDKIAHRSPTFAQRTFESINLRAHEAMEKAHEAAHMVEDFVQHVWDVVGHHSLPEWLKDNEYLLSGHRPQLNSFWACFKSVFRLHSETGNIWTHLLGCIAFIAITTNTILMTDMQFDDKIVYTIYCIGAILCLGFSCLFHTLYCHSPPIGRFFGKLDYCGISIMVMASTVPWLYYGFYCETLPKIVYLTMCFGFGLLCIFVSMKDKFSESSYRPFRAVVFVAFGLSGLIPTGHFVVTQGFYRAFYVSSFGWLVLMALLYLAGATVYAYRIPERFWPGKFDYWGQSHQIFHIFVVAAALVNYHAMNLNLAEKHTITFSECAFAPTM